MNHVNEELDQKEHFETFQRPLLVIFEKNLYRISRK